MEMMEVIGSLWEYGALVFVLAVAVWKLWHENRTLTEDLIDLNRAYAEAIAELKTLIKGDH